MQLRPVLASFVLSSSLIACGGQDGTPEDLGSLESPVSGTWSTLTVDGLDVKTFRDDFGVPHIFAETNRGLFVGYGYAIAADRLWQMELTRRASRGRLAQILGAGSLPTDTLIRTISYTDAELEEQFAAYYTAEEHEAVLAYVEGINRYITEVVAANPLQKLPFEFHALGIGSPVAWTTLDVLAAAVFTTRQFGALGGGELGRLSLLQSLIAAYGPAAGFGMFNDVYWIDDPDSPVSVPSSGAIGKKHGPPAASQLELSATDESADAESEAQEHLESLGVVTKFGSFGFVVGGAISESGAPMIYGGPQFGFNTPEAIYEVQLVGGNGFNVAGVSVPGGPSIVIGRNKHLAWTQTTAVSIDGVDTYVETLCDAGAGPGSGTVFDGTCTPLQARQETIQVRGQAPVTITVLRSVHGPIVGASGATAIAHKRAAWGRELETGAHLWRLNRASDLGGFEAEVLQIPTGHNVLYADKVGNIAYWQAGLSPIRPAGFDPRLPLPGNGSAEWTGAYRPVPKSVNPDRGWLANWNNKPTPDDFNGDSYQGVVGKLHRYRELEASLTALAANAPISTADMRGVVTDIARIKTGYVGRESRFMKPYLLAALDSVPAAHPLAGQARSILEAWDGSTITDAVSSTTQQAGEVIFAAWHARMLTNVFGDELGGVLGTSFSTWIGPNHLQHVLDFAVTGESGVPPSRDYLNGADADVVMSVAFDETLTALAAQLGNDPAAWTQPRGTITFSHPFLGPVASIPFSNRASYGQLIVAENPQMTGENVISLGESGFIGLKLPAGVSFDPHFFDQLPLFHGFQYKPMHFFVNKQLNE